MAQRTVCLCDGKYIGIETIYTVIDGKQINIPEKLHALRIKSRNNELFCPCGCGANLVLVASDRSLREQHFRLKEGTDESKCHVVTEGKTSINSKIILKCWLDDKLGAKDIESRVPIKAISDTERKYEFTFLTREKNLGLIYYYNRLNILDEKLETIEKNKGNTNIIYVVDYRNFTANEQYPEFLMKIQEKQGYCLMLNIDDATYSEAEMYAVIFLKNHYGTWEMIWVEDVGVLSKYSISENGELLYRNRSLLELTREAKTEYENEMAQIKKEEEERQKNKIRAEEERRKAREATIIEYERRQREIEEERQRKVKEANERRERLALEMAEFERELPTLLLQQDREARDPHGNRWVLCSSCGLIAQDSEFSSYGGIGSVNLGICRECSKTNDEYTAPQIDTFARPDTPPRNDKTLCPWCGNKLLRRNGKYGEFWGCSNFPECRYTRRIPARSQDF